MNVVAASSVNVGICTFINCTWDMIESFFLVSISNHTKILSFFCRVHVCSVVTNASVNSRKNVHLVL